MEAQEWCRKYMKSGNVKDLTQAWDLYYHVFRRISKQLPQVGLRVLAGTVNRVLCVLLFMNVLTLTLKHLAALLSADKSLLSAVR